VDISNIAPAVGERRIIGQADMGSVLKEANQQVHGDPLQLTLETPRPQPHTRITLTAGVR
jgi:hypothetical protein